MMPVSISGAVMVPPAQRSILGCPPLLPLAMRKQAANAAGHTNSKARAAGHRNAR